MINFLYTNIGRGHPFYLDGIVERLRQKNFESIDIKDVFEISRGRSLATWKLAEKLYKIGSTDSIIGKWYNKLRDNSEYDKSSLAMKSMGRDIKKKYLDDNTPLVVAHPVLVGMLKGKKNLIYQHGEIAVPKQAVVKGAELVLVPTEECKKPFLQAGYNNEKVVVTGLCIESALVNQAESAFQSRLDRIKSKVPLTGAFFSSGAEPRPHVEKIVASSVKVAQSSENAIVFAKRNGKIDKLLSRITKDLKLTGSLQLCKYDSRSDLEALTCEHFRKFDYFVSPSHERTNWALGLGLPMFILDPPIGPFAPLNRNALLDSGVAFCLESAPVAPVLPKILVKLKNSNELLKMAQKGWGKFPINGFETIADFLINKFPSNS